MLELGHELSITKSEHDANLIREIILYLASAKPSWPLLFRSKSPSKINRRKQIAFGALFTSVEYPWPKLGDLYREPILQISLDRLHRLTGRIVGVGWLQLWGSDYIRIVPSAEVALACLSPLPAASANAYEAFFGVHDDARAMPDWAYESASIVVTNKRFFDVSAYELFGLFGKTAEDDQITPRLEIFLAARREIFSDFQHLPYDGQILGVIHHELNFKVFEIPEVLVSLSMGDFLIHVCMSAPENDERHFESRWSYYG